MKNIIDKRIICLLVTVFSSIVFATQAEEYNSHRSMVLTTIPMQNELAIKVIPVVRTFVSQNGHLAHLKGTDQLLISAKPETIRIFKNNFSSLTMANFNQTELRNKISRELKHNAKNKMESQTLTLKKLQPKVVVKAIRSLVSRDGNLEALSKTNQIIIKDHPVYLEDIVKLIQELDSKAI